ncbi:MAG: hypothetical protein COW65_06070 [Cytophagales bacterium CG18_big_fil_WC_8_21_14_2_50_42_9]|nr:MAG: hypothetical protein COW65_06070 [Cytophagales bacterium CG18_big_fil_WC_8_21_14_2_50_42_9]
MAELKQYKYVLHIILQKHPPHFIDGINIKCYGLRIFDKRITTKQALPIIRIQRRPLVMANIIEENSETGATIAALPDNTLPAIGLVGVALVASVITGIANYNKNKKSSKHKLAREQAMNSSLQAKAQRIQAATSSSMKEVTDDILAKHNLRLRK